MGVVPNRNKTQKASPDQDSDSFQDTGPSTELDTQN